MGYFIIESRVLQVLIKDPFMTGYSVFLKNHQCIQNSDMRLAAKRTKYQKAGQASPAEHPSHEFHPPGRKVHNITQVAPGNAQIIQQLSLVLFIQCGYRLYLHHNTPVHNKVCVVLSNYFPPKQHFKLLLIAYRAPQFPKRHVQCVMIRLL